MAGDCCSMIVVEAELEKVTDTSVLFFRLFIAFGHASTVFFCILLLKFAHDMDEWITHKLKGWSYMLSNGISRYFGANFDFLLLCYFFA